MITSYKLKRDTKIPGHVPIELEIKAEIIADEQTIIEHPKRMDMEKMESLSERVKMRIEEEMVERYEEEIKKARKNKEVDKAWKLASKAGEGYLKRCLTYAGAECKAEMERGGTSKLKKQTIGAEINRKGGEYPRNENKKNVAHLETLVIKIAVKITY